jgi:hypothetical protein
LGSSQLRNWIKTWDGDAEGGSPELSNHRQWKTECGAERMRTIGVEKIVTDASGKGYRLAGLEERLEKNPCENQQEATFRLYPTYDGSFQLPVLVRLKVKLFADSLEFAKNRLSQLTVKGKNKGEILTTHILSDGAIDVGHARRMRFHDRTVRVPLNRWHWQSLYIENVGSETLATAWIDDRKAAEATGKQVWQSKLLGHWHAGFYATIRESNYPVEPFLIGNDDMMIDEVQGIDEAMRRRWFHQASHRARCFLYLE